jgi:DNA helicase-2/ATP-dependent DNA helicase PcrA
MAPLSPDKQGRVSGDREQDRWFGQSKHPVQGASQAPLTRHPSLDQFLQELGLRSKEPSPKPGTVTLMTIHGAKGREFDFVYVVGLAEDVMPSYQSRQKGDSSAEMEEERRNCFVAITRAKEGLILSWADRYRGYVERPSRFLLEMGVIERLRS